MVHKRSSEVKVCRFSSIQCDGHSVCIISVMPNNCIVCIGEDQHRQRNCGHNFLRSCRINLTESHARTQQQGICEFFPLINVTTVQHVSGFNSTSRIKC